MRRSARLQIHAGAAPPEAAPRAQKKQLQKKKAPKRKRKREEVEVKQTVSNCSVETMRMHERAAVADGAQMVAGVDEAGRGPLAGPVVAAACHVPLDFDAEWLDRINDSKGVKEEEREELPADPPMPPGVKEGVPVIKGDAKVLSIAAASIIAKVTRDRIMRELDTKHPEYGFGKHKGYGVAAHTSAIHKHGAIPGVHRYTFAPIKGTAAAKKQLGLSKEAAAVPAGKPKKKKAKTNGRALV